MFLKVAQVAGFLGSGKTTTILKLAKRLGQNGKKVAVIVNSLGGVPVDGMVFRESGLKVEEIGGGCICCELAVNLANTLRLLKEVYDPDVVIIEPEGLAIPNQVRGGITSAKVEVEVCPILVLFDVTNAEESLDEKRLGYIVLKQLADAEIIAINKIDLVNGSIITKYEAVLKTVNPSALIVKISALKEVGFDKLTPFLRVANET